MRIPRSPYIQPTLKIRTVSQIETFQGIKKAKLLTDNIYLKTGLKVHHSNFAGRKLNIKKVTKKLLLLR